MSSDAKSPKAKLKAYFGFDTLPVDATFTGLGLMSDSDEWDDDGQDIP